MSWRLIRPDPPEGGELPATEFVHPAPLLALALLATNDHLLKGSGWLPGVLTGKISDFTGLFFFPLLLTACADVLVYGVNTLLRRHRLDASLRTWKLIAAGLFTAGLFLAIKLSSRAAEAVLALVARLDLSGWLPAGQIIQDPTDLVALPAIALAIWFGRRRLVEIPPARLAHLRHRVAAGGTTEAVLRAGLDDCRRLARRPRAVFEALVHGLGPDLEASAHGPVEPRKRDRAIRALSAWRAASPRS